jgi:hypothetical protein
MMEGGEKASFYIKIWEKFSRPKCGSKPQVGRFRFVEYHKLATLRVEYHKLATLRVEYHKLAGLRSCENHKLAGLGLLSTTSWPL